MFSRSIRAGYECDPNAVWSCIHICERANRLFAHQKPDGKHPVQTARSTGTIYQQSIRNTRFVNLESTTCLPDLI